MSQYVVRSVAESWEDRFLEGCKPGAITFDGNVLIRFMAGRGKSMVVSDLKIWAALY
jgi:hypothetical protein